MAPSKVSILPKASITAPATVALVAYLVLVAIVLLPIDMQLYDQDKKAYVTLKYSFGQRLLLVFLLVLPFVLGVYSINCMMVGGCRVWSWVVALATILWSIIMVITTVMNRSFRLEDVVA